MAKRWSSGSSTRTSSCRTWTASGFYPREYQLYNAFIRKPNGIILVTGPTGSGKTTTLYSTLRTLSSPEVNIVTIEDPIEMVMEEFNQIGVQQAIGVTFATILRNILRQDPDIIMIGEIRDRETAENAVQAALTGHLVLSTLHTNDAASAITRLIDLGVQPLPHLLHGGRHHRPAAGPEDLPALQHEA